MLQSTAAEETPLTKQINGLTRQILIIAGFALVASIALGISRGGALEELFLTAVALVIAAVPTALPAIDTAILSRGSQQLAKEGAIVKQLRSVETLGSTSALNSDKTGTLTMNQMTAVELSIAGRRYTITGTGYSTTGVITQAAGQTPVPLEPYLLPMALCSDAEVRDDELTGDPTEGALVVLATKGGVDVDLTRETYPRLATLPFDAAYKLMATFHDWTDESGKKVVRAYIKGSQTQLLERAASIDGPDGKPVPVAQLRDNFLGESDRMAKEGMRLMATGFKDFDPATFDPDADLLKAIEGLTLLALVGITDPPRPAAKAAIAEAHAAGMQIRMITGDAALTGAVVAQQLGIEGRAITGAEWSAMSDEEARSEVGDIGVIGRVTPQDKVRLVDVLREEDYIVAMTGDGVNDAPAIKKADIGIAMGITGTEVTKAAADMILSDDDYATIIKAVSIGRNVYDNLMRFIRYQIAACYGYITVFLGASIFNILNGVPFLPLQTMWLNFTVNVFQAIGLGFGRPRDGLMEEKPRPKDQKILPPQLNAWLAVVGLWMGVGTLGLIAWADGTYDPTVAQTMGVTTFSLFRIVSSWETADEHRSVFSGYIFNNPTLLKVTGLSIVAIVLATELSILQEFLSMSSLTGEQWIICIGIALSLLVPEEVRKFFKVRAGHEMPEPTVAAPAATAPATA
jgi:Ca2+-transporting ATPase